MDFSKSKWAAASLDYIYKKRPEYINIICRRRPGLCLRKKIRRMFIFWIYVDLFQPNVSRRERERASTAVGGWALIQPGRELRLSTRSKHLMVYMYTLYSPIEEAARTNRRRRETIRRYCKPFSAAAAAILSGEP